MKSVVRDAMILVPVLATLGIAGYLALRWPNDWWVAGLCTFTGVVLLIAVLAAIFRSGATRAFWTGFAAFGGTYALIVAIPGVGDQTRPLLITSKVIYRLYLVWNPAPTDPSATDVVYTQTGTTTGPATAAIATTSGPGNVTMRLNGWNPTSTPSGSLAQMTSAPGGVDVAVFERIGHALATLVIALIGGLAGRFLEATRRSREERAGSHESHAPPEIEDAALRDDLKPKNAATDARTFG